MRASSPRRPESELEQRDHAPGRCTVKGLTSKSIQMLPTFVLHTCLPIIEPMYHSFILSKEDLRGGKRVLFSLSSRMQEGIWFVAGALIPKTTLTCQYSSALHVCRHSAAIPLFYCVRSVPIFFWCCTIVSSSNVPLVPDKKYKLGNLVVFSSSQEMLLTRP